MPLVTSRALARPAPLVAVLVNVLIVCTLVAGIGASLPLVQEQTLHTRLAELSPDAAVVTAVSTYDEEDPDAQDEVVTDVLTPVTAVAGGDIVRRLESGSYDLLAPAGRPYGFVALDGADSRLDYPSGRAPRATSGAIEVAARTDAGLQTGDRLTLASRSDGSRVSAVVVGLFRVVRGSERWVGELDRSTLLSPAERFGEVASAGSSARWRAVPTLSALRADQIDELSEAVSTAAAGGMGRASEQTSASVRAETGLVDALAQRARELVVLRALLLVPAALLLLLGAACLFLVAAGLADSRTREQSLLRSRGAGPRQLVLATALETLLLCGAAVTVAPLLAHVVIRIGDLRPPLTGAAWVAAALAGGVCAIALVVPTALRALTGDRGEQLSAEKQRRRSLTALVAALLLVVVLGALAVIELRGFGAQVRAATVSSGTVDPLLVVAPSLLLLALAVLAALLVLPLLFRLVAAALGRRGVSFALGSRFAARSPATAVPLALVVILTAGTLSFAAAQRASSESAREARADFEVGADVRVTPPADALRAGPADERRLLAELPGVQRVRPVHRDQTYIQGLPAGILVTGVSADDVADVLPEGAVTDGGWRQLVDRTWRGSQGLRIPAGTDALDLRITAERLQLKQVSWLLADPDGGVHLVTARGDGHRAGIRLDATIPAGSRLVAFGTGPTLRGFGNPALPDREGKVSITVRADDQLLTRSGRWWVGGQSEFVVFGTPPRLPATVPVALTDELAGQASLGVGDSFDQDVLGIPMTLEVVALVPYLRTVTESEGNGLLLDLDTALPTLVAGGLTDAPDEWWLDVAPGTSASVAAALEQHPGVAETVVTRADVAKRLRQDPSTGGVALGQLLVLTAGGCLVVGALLLLSVVLLRRRERSAQDHTLVTVGARRRDLLGVLCSEYALTTGTAAVLGVVAGAAVAQVTLLSMTLGPDGRLLLPAPELVLPWATLLVPLALMVALPLLVTVLLGRWDQSRARVASGASQR